MKQRITIKDIAKALNIHHSTVSRALRNDKRVKDDTCELINKYAIEHGYQINMSALELRGSKRNTIAVIVPNISHLFFSEIVSRFTDIASHHGYVVSIFQSNENLEREKEIVDTIIQYNFSGVVASISMESYGVSHFEKLAQHNIPLVMFDRVNYAIACPKVVVNHEQVTHQAIDLLVSKGYQRIAHISATSKISVFGERQAGYMAGVKKHQLNYVKIHTVSQAFDFENAAEVAKDIFCEIDGPEAIICDSQNLLYGLIGEIKNRGLKIPQDIALLTFGESPNFEIMDPGITSIVQPNKEIADTTLGLLIEQIEGHCENNKVQTLNAEIQVRDSI